MSVVPEAQATHEDVVELLQPPTEEEEETPHHDDHHQQLLHDPTTSEDAGDDAATSALIAEAAAAAIQAASVDVDDVTAAALAVQESTYHNQEEEQEEDPEEEKQRQQLENTRKRYREKAVETSMLASAAGAPQPTSAEVTLAAPAMKTEPQTSPSKRSRLVSGSTESSTAGGGLPTLAGTTATVLAEVQHSLKQEEPVLIVGTAGSPPSGGGALVDADGAAHPGSSLGLPPGANTASHEEQLAARRLKDRQRYANMSLDQRQVYNSKRREQYHRQSELSRQRRRERERTRYHALESDQAQHRNSQRAKLERERYQRLSPAELEAKNRKRRERAAVLRQKKELEKMAEKAATAALATTTTPEVTNTNNVPTEISFKMESDNDHAKDASISTKSVEEQAGVLVATEAMGV
eukprot:CAMPEP_0172455414 /NCGR_PEP_ID=MMETSP1065-20121228/12056_1 /TAXON_ID=265537 /ORGANISM="Amphiprora paludosa, Strain CCMP125" /LENGTH=408 /DNA_ID=CAMNT_0013207875 /DNA_START=97 /DNA_END=1323 /DNA_ORIENTATION=-